MAVQLLDGSPSIDGGEAEWLLNPDIEGNGVCDPQLGSSAGLGYLEVYLYLSLPSLVRNVAPALSSIRPASPGQASM